MSLYGGTQKGLNEYESDPQADVLYPADAQPESAPQPDPTEGANAALGVIVNPTSLIADAAASPSLPWPVAVIGICIVGMIWANYLDGGRKK